MSNKFNPVPEYLQDTYDLLKCAFPSSIPEDEYFQVIRLLHPYMSYRALTKVLAAVQGGTYADFMNDTMGFDINSDEGTESLEVTEKKLIECGYKKWCNDNQL